MTINPTNKHNIMKIFSILLLIHGGFFTMFFAFGFFAGTDFFEVFLAWLLIGVIPLSVGWILYKKSKTHSMNEVFENLEMQVIKLASTMNGKLKAVDLTLNLNISMDASKDILEKLVIQGIADTDITESGAVVYLFRELIGS